MKGNTWSAVTHVVREGGEKNLLYRIKADVKRVKGPLVISVISIDDNGSSIGQPCLAGPILFNEYA